jgi:raffinose/stachyose/melibiose transport system substrate-binding protein
MMKRIVSIICIFILMLGCLCGCARKGGAGEVYYLNFKPEQDRQWQALAKAYTDETGVKVTVVTAAAGTYEDTLSAEIVKTKAPTLFQVNGPVGLAGWKDYCYDLSDTELYRQLTDDDFVLKENDEVLGIAYVLETYGLIYNKTILDRYFKLENAKIKSLDEVNGFDSFKRLAEDLQANKKTLGIEGAFTSAGMDSSSDWRFKTHLANLPIYYEYEQEEIDRSPAIKGTYLKEYRQIWDLYLNTSTCAPGEIGAKTGDEAASEFNTGKAVFYQNGTWAWNEEMERAIGAENVGMIPI